MLVEQLLCGELANFTYIVADEKSRLAAVIDPADSKKVLKVVKKRGLKVKYIINTHSHFDHIVGNEEIKKVTKARIVMHRNSKLKNDMKVEDGDVVKAGNLKIKVIYTPGHTEDSICLLVGNKLFTGDTLFIGSCGRTDLPGGSSKKLSESLKKLAALGDDVEVWPGHNYGKKRFSTIGEEKELNPFFRKSALNLSSFISLKCK